MRLKGRFANSSLEHEKHLVILYFATRTVRSCFKRLIILDAHEAAMYHGVETTLARNRRHYWIVKGRKNVKEVLRKCVISRY